VATLRYWAWRIERERRAKKTKLVRVVRKAETVVVGAPSSDEAELRIVISSESVRLELARKDITRALEGLAALASASSKGAT
jgi:RNase P/RNase MRP subunit POP5